MKGTIKICKNPDCGEFITCFPIKVCPHCGSRDIEPKTIELKMNIGGDEFYEKTHQWALLDYLGSHHILIHKGKQFKQEWDSYIITDEKEWEELKIRLKKPNSKND